MTQIPNTVVGLMALIITVLAGVCVRFFYLNSALYKRIDDLQEQRVQDAKTVTDKVTEPLREIAQYTELSYGKIMAGKKRS